MLRNRRLARHVAGVGWGELRRQIEYKTSWAGGRVVVADRWYPSSKTCSACGVVKAKLRLSERTYHCDQCGLVLDRDLNAARNLAQLVDEVSGRHVLPEFAWATVNEPDGNPHKTRTTRAAGTATGRPTPTGAGQRRRGNAPTQDTFLHVGRCERPWCPGRHLGLRRRPTGGALVVHPHRRSGRAGQPIERHVGQQLIAIDDVLRQFRVRVGPFLELLDDPGELADR